MAGGKPGHGPYSLLLITEKTCTDCRCHCRSQRPCLPCLGYRNLAAQAVCEHLRPVRRSGSPAGQDSPREADAGIGQHFNMAAMLEHDAFEDRSQHDPLPVPTGKAEEAATPVRSEPATIEKGMEKRIVRRGRRRRDKFVDQGKGIVVMATAL